MFCIAWASHSQARQSNVQTNQKTIKQWHCFSFFLASRKNKRFWRCGPETQRTLKKFIVGFHITSLIRIDKQGFPCLSKAMADHLGDSGCRLGWKNADKDDFQCSFFSCWKMWREGVCQGSHWDMLHYPLQKPSECMWRKTAVCACGASHSR